MDLIEKKLNKFTPSNPCLKQVVKALIVTKDGQEIFGSNTINTQVTICPREEKGCVSGEGYELCRNVCLQQFHAEVDAIRRVQMIGVDLDEAKMYLTGHTYCCDNCLQVVESSGIKRVEVLDSGKVYDF